MLAALVPLLPLLALIPSTRCGTPWLLEDRAGFEQAAQLGGRPLPCSGCTICGDDVCVHYANPGDSAYAQSTFQMAEIAWDIEVNQMGWRPAPPDGIAGPQLDIYLADTGWGAEFGYTDPEADNLATPWDDSASYIVIDHNTSLAVMETFVSHEMNHAFQFAYDYQEAAFVYEATATWIEDHVNDEINDYRYFLGDFQASPEKALDFATYQTNYMYGGAIFMFFLSERFDNGGVDLVRDMWENSKQNGGGNEPDFYDGLTVALPGKGGTTVQDAYSEFAYWRLFTGNRADTTNYFEEGGAWPGVPMIGQHTLTTELANTSFDPPMELGTNYAFVNPAGGTKTDRLAVSFQGDPLKAWQVMMVGRRQDASTCIATMRAEGGSGGVFVDGLGDYSSIHLAFANLGAGAIRDPDGGNYATSQLSYDIEYDTSAGAISIDGKQACGTPVVSGDDDDDPRGCACNVGAPAGDLAGAWPALFLFAVLLRRRQR